MTEQLASPTLALLYLAQGHRSRAQATLREVLEAEPTNGYALALHDRMQSRPHARLEARFVVTPGSAMLELAWSIPAELVPEGEDRLDVVVAFATGDRASLRFTSIPCLDRVGSQQIPAPPGPAAAAVALLASKPCGPVRVLAVADPLHW